MIKDDVLVFDCVAHPFNFDASNVLGNAGELLYELSVTLQQRFRRRNVSR